jgi:dipeptidyl aminopeptidase/acylaminoacyl peptidase
MITTILLAAALTITDYATLPNVSSPQFSPDGTRIAYVVTKADLGRSAYDSDVWLIDVDGTNDRQLTSAPGADFRPRWSPDGKQLAFLSDRGGRNAIHVIDVRGGEPRRLGDEPTAVREFEWSPDGSRIAFTRSDAPTAEEEKRAKEKDDARVVGEGAKHVRLYTIDVKSGAVALLTKDDASVFDFDWSPDGSTIAFSRADSVGLDGMYRTDIHVVTLADGSVRPLVVRPGLDRSPAYSPDGRTIAFTSAGGQGEWIVEHDLFVVPAGGGNPKLISSALGRTPESFEWSSDGKALWVETPWGSTTQLFKLAADGSSVQKATDVEGVISDVDVHRDRAAYAFESLAAPPELHVYGTRMTNHNAAARAIQRPETRVIRWKNPKDGLEIEGLLTLPVGWKEGERVPLVTFVHGGPASRFFQGYIGYLGHVYPPDAFAAEGFAVLRPNPRGTGGYGLAFRRANLGDWAGMDWIDINAGIDKLIADGIADRDRLGLMGWSYGGYIASWAIGHSDRFKAISIGAPVVDLLSFHGTTDIRDFIPSYFAGMPLEALRAHSPMWNLKKTDAKVLIQHGEADDRVPLSQGTMLYRALEELGVDVTMVVYPRTPHVPREPKLRIDVARRNVEFFRNALKEK